MSKEATAAQTGSENMPAPDAGKTPAPAKGEKTSVRASVERAMDAAEVDQGPPSQTDQARAVLKGGAGADEKLVGDDTKKRDKAARATPDPEKPDAKDADKDDAGEKAPKKKATTSDDGKPKAKAKAADDADDDDDQDDDAGEKGKGERNADGTFKAKDADKDDVGDDDDDAEDTDTKVSEPPKRLSEAAKKAWGKTPKEIRGDVHRMNREFEGAFAKHKDAADNWSKLHDGFSPMLDKDGKAVTYGELSRQMKTTVKDALDRYVAVDMQLSKDPIGTIDQMLKARGMDFRKVAEAYLKIDPAELEQHTETQKLRAENEALKREKAQGATGQEREQRARVDAHIETFYEAHPRLKVDKDFEKTFGKLFTSGAAETLEEAFELAEVKHPRKGPSAKSPDTADQTRKSELSDSGGRTEASDARSRRERSKSIKGAAERAAREADL